MDLEFSTRSLSYLKCVLREVYCQEETAETIVPDSEPDMEAIIASYADIVLRGKECKNGCITVSGGIKGSILYRTEQQALPNALQFYIPFTLKAENKALTEQSKVICSVKVRSADGRMLNSRKAMLRVNISCLITAFEHCEETIFELQNKPSALQIKESTYQVCCPSEVAEKSFTITEDLDTSLHSKSPVQLVKDNCRLEIIEKKLVGNKAVFKGIAHYKMLLRSDDGTLTDSEHQLPFSQYCEFANDYEDQPFDLAACITGCDLELTDDGNISARLALHILIQSLVFDEHTLTFVDDAYCIGKDFEPQWSKISTYGRLDSTKDRHQLRCRLQGDIVSVLHTDMCVDHPSIEVSVDRIDVLRPISVQLLGLNAAGETVCLHDKIQDKQSFALSGNGKCYASSSLCGTTSASVYSGGAETCAELSCENTFMVQQDLVCLSGGRIKDLPQSETDRPSVILKKVPKSVNLWDIAKTTQSKTESICEANHLQDGVLSENKMLLIPVG